MRRGSNPFLLFAILTVAVSIPEAAFGQGYAGNAFRGPTTIYNGSATEKVDMSAGSLSIKLPLLHQPGRGIDTDLVLGYNSKIWGVGGGPAIRRTDYTYLHDTDTNYAATGVHILDRKTSELVYTAGGVLIAKTLFEYDNTTITSTSSSQSPQHDYTTHGSSYTRRGNITKIKRWRNTDAALLTTTNTYNDVGNLLQTTDPGNHTVSFDYTDNYFDTTNRTSRAFVTKVTRPQTNGISHIVKSQYYFFSGLSSASCGENFPSAASCVHGLSAPQPDYMTQTYDALNRPKINRRGDDGQTTLDYNETTLPISITATIKIDGTQSLVGNTVYDGLGRTKQFQELSNPLCVVKTDYTYDELGRLKTTSNPYCTTGDPTYGITTNNYDALSRVTSVVYPSGGSVTTSYSGNTTTVTDQQGKARKSETDGLGRLIRIWEPDSGQNLVHVTRYQYDVMGNMECVHQKNNDATADKACSDATVPSTWRPRRFSYNSLAQLLSATYPELGTLAAPGTLTYTYDNDGNMLTKTDPRGVVINYNPAESPIDALHRVTKKTYSGGTPPVTDSPVFLTYDVASVDGLSIQNPIGRVVKSAQGSARTVNSYDVAGRIKDQWQCTPLNCGSSWYQLTYNYNLVDAPTTYTDGAGHTFTQTYNAAAQVTSLTSSLNNPPEYPSNLATGIGYFPSGTLKKLTLGNGLHNQIDMNNRLQPCRIRVRTSAMSEVLCSDPDPTGDFVQFKYFYGASNNGNIMTWSATGQQAFSRVFTYDELNRVRTMTDTQCNYTWNYDIWGNRLSQDATGGAGPCGEHFPTITVQNRISELGYDLAGNVTSDGSTTYQWDAEGRMKSINGGGTNPEYTYDANGRRVRKKVGSITTEFVHDLDGNVVAEFEGTTWTKGYVYLHGQLLSQYSSGTTYFAHRDHLGSTRVLSNRSGGPHESYDFWPFGDAPAYQGTTTNHKFTGKERDSESGLDFFGARYHDARSGRFISVDPSGVSVNFLDPQTLNRYPYTFNRPTKYTDPNGKWLKREHERIIDDEFKFLSDTERQDLKIASEIMDFDQTPEGSHKHAMGAGYFFARDENKKQAAKNTKKFIDNKIAQAVNEQLEWESYGLKGNSPSALYAFGEALHTVTDAYSPLHRGHQAWHGLGTLFSDILGAAHGIREYFESEDDDSQARHDARVAARFLWLRYQKQLEEARKRQGCQQHDASCRDGVQ